MANLNGFDAATVEPQAPMEALPSGKYTAMITASEMRVTKDGLGQYLQLELTVTEGEFANRKVWDRLNLVNKSDIAVRIAKGSLSAICRAVGVMQPQDSAQLHNIPMSVTLKCSTRDGETRNDVKGYAAVSTAAQPASQPATHPAAEPPAQPQQDAGTAPWA